MFVQEFTAQTELIGNDGQRGPVGATMSEMRFEPGMLRPYFDEQGVRCVTLNAGQRWDPGKQAMVPVMRKVPIANLMAQGQSSPVFNATSLRKDEWITLDQAVIRAARKRLRAWQDLAASNTYSVPGMSKTLLEHETMNDPGEAVVDMDGLTDARSDAPRVQLQGLPLPITHSDFNLSSRVLAVSRNTGTPIDATLAEAAGRRVAEQVEKTLIGSVTGLTYGNASDYGQNPTVYGYTNYPDRITKTDMAASTGSNGPTVLDNWLALRDLLYDNNFYGPFMAYVSNDYDRYLDGLFSTAEPSAGSLRRRLLEIDGINGIKRLDYLDGPTTILLVQMTPDVARAVNGMDLTTVQWESKGGMQLNFKVMAIWVPQLRSDYEGQCGIAHGTIS